MSDNKKSKQLAEKKAIPQKKKKTYVPKKHGKVVLIRWNGDMIVCFDGNNERIKANNVPKGDYVAGDDIKI